MCILLEIIVFTCYPSLYSIYKVLVIRLVSLGPDLDMDLHPHPHPQRQCLGHSDSNLDSSNGNRDTVNSFNGPSDNGEYKEGSDHDIKNKTISNFGNLTKQNGQHLHPGARIRILSVEQKMLRTAEQKLNAERIILAQGMFDMGTAVMDSQGTYTLIYTYMYMFIYIYVYIYVYMYIYVCIYIYVYTCIYMYVYIYV
jgi:hypothetical protein